MNNIEDINSKILKKVLVLIEKGYDLSFCLKKYPGHSSQIKEYFGFLDDFENLKGISPDFSRKQELFSRILKENKISEKAVVLPVKIRKNYLKPVLAFCISFVFVMFAFTGTVFASEKTLPGDTLYPVKITTEKMQIFLYPETKKGSLYYNFLNKRISEADRLIEKNINPDDENFIFILAQIEEQYNNCKRYGYFMDNNDSPVIEQMRQIRRHGMKYQDNTNNPSGNQETEKYSYGDETGATDSTENCMDEYGSFRNKGSLNGEGSKEGTGNNGKK